jgi:hypothetical protein
MYPNKFIQRHKHQETSVQLIAIETKIKPSNFDNLCLHSREN